MEKREIKKILKQELEKLGFRYTKSAYYYIINANLKVSHF